MDHGVSSGNSCAKEECLQKRKHNKRCKNIAQDCYSVHLSLPEIDAPVPQCSQRKRYTFFNKLFCMPSHEIIQDVDADGDVDKIDLCDNEVISLTNQCGEITLSKQCLEDEDKYADVKQSKKAAKAKKKLKIKQGKERFKECQKRAKMIVRKYKDREHMRKENEKEYFKKCLKFEKQKVIAAKTREKEKKQVAKLKMKQNKKKHQMKLKKLKARLRQRCEDLIYKNPTGDEDTDSDSCDSMAYEDPVELMSSQPHCEKNITCINLTSPNEKPMFGACKMPKQVCLQTKDNAQKLQIVSPKSKAPCG